MGTVGVRVETTSWSCIVICGVCGARFVQATRTAALTEASQHETFAHPSHRAARDRLARG